MLTTTRLGLEYPQTSDQESVFPPVSAQQMGVLDNAAIYAEGTLVGRSISEHGQFYRTTDAGAETFSWTDGSLWLPLGLIPASTSTSASVISGQAMIVTGSSAVTITLPSATTGAMVAVVNRSTGVTTVSGSNIQGPGLSSASSFTLGITGAYASLLSDGTNWIVMAGGPSAGMPIGGGSTNISTSQSTSSTSYTTLSTADQVTGLVVPTNGLIAVWYQATWSESVAGAARAAIFIGSNQLKTPAVQFNASVTQAAATDASSNAGANIPLASCPAGLISSNASSGTYSGDVTTGQAQGAFNSYFTMELNGSVGTPDAFGSAMPFGGPCYIDNLPAGTYTISVEFKASSGSVTAANRRLRAQVIAFS